MNVITLNDVKTFCNAAVNDMNNNLVASFDPNDIWRTWHFVQLKTVFTDKSVYVYNYLQNSDGVMNDKNKLLRIYEGLDNHSHLVILGDYYVNNAASLALYKTDPASWIDAIFNSLLNFVDDKLSLAKSSRLYLTRERGLYGRKQN